MAHQVETMAYTNEVPWHGLGNYVADAPNVKAMIKLAGINWKVERKPLYLAGQKEPVPGFSALCRDKDGALFDVVGSKYEPVQNEEAFEFFTEFVEAGDATMETAGSLRGGKYVWGLANLKSSFKLKGKDEVKGYLLVGVPHEQGKSVLIKLTNIRVVCNNTLTLALRDKGLGEFRMAHRSKFDKEAIKRAKTTLGIAREQFSEFKANAERLSKIKMTDKDALDILAPIFCPKMEVVNPEKLTPKLTMLIDVLHKAPGAEPGTAWGVLNAATYYADHIASRTPDKRMTNAWFGKTASQKQRVLEALLAA